MNVVFSNTVLRVRRHWPSIGRALVQLITLVSLVIAIGHWRSTNLVTQSLNTRYIGSFPHYLPELTTLVESASDTLLVAPGVAGYGIYSDHSAYISYHSALERKVGLREFKVILLDEARTGDLVQAQLLGLNFDEDIKSSKAFRQFEKWSNREQPKNLESFQRALGDIETVTRTQDYIRKGIKCSELSGSMPIYVWIADSKMAVFSIPDLQTPRPEENAFITNDSRLIKELITIFRTYEDSSTHVSQTNTPQRPPQ